MKQRAEKFSLLFLKLIFIVLNRCLRCGQTSDRDTVRTAGNIVQSDAVTEFDRAWIAAMFAADTQLDVRTGLAAQFCRHRDQLANAMLIQTGKRILLVNLLVVIMRQESAGVITREAECHLR